MLATLKVHRYTPEAAAGDGGTREAQYHTYTLDVPEYYTVLDALIKVREELDGTLAVRCSCRAAVCGSCAMRINGQSRLACKTKLITIAPPGQTVTVEPMANIASVCQGPGGRAVAPAYRPQAGARIHCAQRGDARSERRDGLHHVWRVRLGVHGTGDRPELPRPGCPGQGIPLRT
ncbi:MAG: hypothetical protein C4289_07450 [Chloroflexota bacterium]